LKCLKIDEHGKQMIRNAKLTRALGAWALIVPWPALADATSQPAQNSFFSILFVAWGIAYLSRRRAIGGWLFYFYLQLYLSLLFSFIFLPGIISNLGPNGWDSSLRYVMFLASTVPTIATQYVEVFAASRLLRTRNAANLKFLRIVLAVLVVASGVGMAIDIQYFETNAVFDVLTFVFAVIWSLYFWRAQRVRKVFVENSWTHPDAIPKRKRTPAEWAYIWKRTAVIAVVAYVVMLVIIGINLGDQKPDVHMFTLAGIDAVIVAAISLLFPIRKKKLAALTQGLPP
jgi:hypothetical protein